jgi:hypothetical protein
MAAGGLALNMPLKEIRIGFSVYKPSPIRDEILK